MPTNDELEDRVRRIEAGSLIRGNRPQFQARVNEILGTTTKINETPVFGDSALSVLEQKDAAPGLSLPVPPAGTDTPAVSETETTEPLDVKAIPGLGNNLLPLTYTRQDGTIGLNRAPTEEDFPEEVNELIQGDYIAGIQYALSGKSAFSPQDRISAISKKITAAEKGWLAPTEDMQRMAQQAGMTPNEYEHWKKRDPKRIANQTLAMTIAQSEWATQEAQKPHSESEFQDLAILAELDKFMVEKRDDWWEKLQYRARSAAGGLAEQLVGLGEGATGLIRDVVNMQDQSNFLQTAPLIGDALRAIQPAANHWADYYQRYGDYINTTVTRQPLETSNATTVGCGASGHPGSPRSRNTPLPENTSARRPQWV